MTILKRLLRPLLGSAAGGGSDVAAEPPVPGAAQRIEALECKLEYALLEVSRLRSIVRYLAGDEVARLPLAGQTRSSFNYQWSDDTPDSNWPEHYPELKQREPETVLSCTQLPREWFAGKEVLDAGCGAGRFTYALASLGARVVSVDQAENGVRNTQRNCAEFSERIRVYRHNLLEPLDESLQVDLAWSFGVLHHTGDTYRSFKNVARAVRPGGYLFMMIYAEPAEDLGSYAYYAEVEKLRRLTVNRTFEEKWELIHQLKPENAGGWFDAVSPIVNDTYSFHELESWLIEAGFVDIRRTLDAPNHHVVARKSEETRDG